MFFGSEGVRHNLSKGLCKNYSGITIIFFHSILLALEKTQVSYRLNLDLDEVVAISCLAAIGDITNAPGWPHGFSPCDITRCGKVIYGGCCCLVFSSLPRMVYTNQLKLCQVVSSHML